MHTIDFIDSHTGGEPTRTVLAGMPDLGLGSLAERRARFAAEHDRWRRAVVLEPRGSDTVVGALLLPPADARACAGVIYFNNVGYLGMCGHGTIGVVHTLHHLGRIGPGRHALDTPVGLVGFELHGDGRVSVDNVASWRHARAVTVTVPGHGPVTGDVAWGGNWFFISHDCPLPIDLAHRHQLTAYATAIRTALGVAGVTGAQGAQIDHVELSVAADCAADCAQFDARNFVLCPGLAYDRSPCGTGTSAVLACRAADGLLAPGQLWRQAGILGSVFEASYRPAAHGIHPRITGRASVVAQGQLLVDEADPMAWGIGP